MCCRVHDARSRKRKKKKCKRKKQRWGGGGGVSRPLFVFESCCAFCRGVWSGVGVLGVLGMGVTQLEDAASSRSPSPLRCGDTHELRPANAIAFVARLHLRFDFFFFFFFSAALFHFALILIFCALRTPPPRPSSLRLAHTSERGCLDVGVWEMTHLLHTSSSPAHIWAARKIHFSAAAAAAAVAARAESRAAETLRGALFYVPFFLSALKKK